MQIEGETVETMAHFILGGAPKSLEMVTAAMKLKELAPWKEGYDKLIQHIKKQRYHLLTKVHIAKAVFPVVMYGCERWAIKKAECQRIDAFKLQCRRILLRVPWTARRSNQSVLKDINLYTDWKTDGEAEASILWPPDTKSPFTGKGPDAGKD